MKVELNMQYGRPHMCFSDAPGPELIDAQDGQRVYEILDSAKLPGPDARYEYRSSK